jgi:hypothetical protein
VNTKNIIEKQIYVVMNVSGSPAGYRVWPAVINNEGITGEFQLCTSNRKRKPRRPLPVGLFPWRDMVTMDLVPWP